MNYFDIQELASIILKLNYDELVDNGEEEMIDERLYEEFGIDLEQFYNIIKALLPLTVPIFSELSKEWYHAFVVNEGTYNVFRAIVKQKVI